MPERTTARRVSGAVLLVVGLAGISTCMTVLYLSSRSVMAIGGACASGNSPYEIATPCPKGVGELTAASIPLGIIFLGIFMLGAHRFGAYMSLAFLAWPALFLSLGYNFLDFGLNPGDERSVDGGFLTCAVIFGLMGGVPLLGALANPKAVLRFFWPPEHPREPGGGGLAALSSLGPALKLAEKTAARTARHPVGTAPEPPDPAPAAEDDLVGDLARLADLHRRGALSDAEFAAAKQRLIGSA